MLVFLDRDGTINRKAPEGEYVRTWDEFEFLPGAQAAIRSLNELGATVVVVTNQRGVALGLMSEGDVHAIHRQMQQALAAADAHVDAVYVCTHGHDECDCRKPGTGMFVRAVQELGVDDADAVVVGDSASDMEAGRRLGYARILIANAAHRDADVSYVASSLADAVSWIRSR